MSKHRFEKQKVAHSKANNSSHESTSANRRAKQAFFNTVTSIMHNYHISPKNKCSILSKLMKSNKISSIPPIIEDDQVVTDPQQKADIFNNFFASKLSVQKPQDPAPHLPPRSNSEYLVGNPVQAALPSNKRQKAKHFFEYFWLGMSLRPKGCRNLF